MGTASRPSLFDSSVWWVAVSVLPVTVGLATIDRVHIDHNASLWSSRAFQVGIAFLAIAAATVLWSLILFVAHRHAAGHNCPDPAVHLTVTGSSRDGSHASPQVEQAMRSEMERTVIAFFENEPGYLRDSPGDVFGIAKRLVQELLGNSASDPFAAFEREIETRRVRDPNWSVANKMSAGANLVHALGISSARPDRARVFLDMPLPTIRAD